MRLRERRSGELIHLGTELGNGGQGTAYRDAAKPGRVVKLYDHPPPELGAKLDAMIAHPPPGLLDLAAPAAWPLDLVVPADGAGGCVGLLIPLVPGRVHVGELFNPAARPAGTDYRTLAAAARNMCELAARFHLAGVVGGDVFNPRNLLADPATGHVAAIDVESSQVTAGRKVFEAWGWVVEYTSRRFQAGAPPGTLRQPADDLFSLAVLVFQALMNGHHPFGGVPRSGGPAAPVGTCIANGWWAYGRRGPYRPPMTAPAFDGLPADVRALFETSFEAGHADPVRRPAAQTWVDALDRWLAAGVAPPALPAPPATGAGVFARLPALPRPGWVDRVNAWTRRHPQKVTAAVLAAGLAAGGWWWATRTPSGAGMPPPPYLGGRPTPELWKRLRDQSR